MASTWRYLNEYMCIAMGYQNFKVVPPTSYLTKTSYQSPDSDNSLISKTQKGWFFNCFQIPRLGFLPKKKPHLTFALHPSWLIEMGPKRPGCYLGRYLLKNLDVYLDLQVTKPLPPWLMPTQHKFSKPERNGYLKNQIPAQY
jgi:hypothetical protein